MIPLKAANSPREVLDLMEERRFVRCDYCGGSGEPYDGVTCAECGGSGLAEQEVEPITMEDLDRK